MQREQTHELSVFKMRLPVRCARNNKSNNNYVSCVCRPSCLWHAMLSQPDKQIYRKLEIEIFETHCQADIYNFQKTGKLT